ncbi:hypothetical protein [Sphingomonas pokkalii]|nr:hypothetical protein [Sphingomonas pokkalii]
MIATTLLLLWLALLAAGDTPTGRLLHRVLVVAPARWGLRWSRGNVILIVSFLLFATFVLWLMEEEGGILVGMMAPELIGWVTMFDIGVLVDAALATVTLASAMRLRGFRQWVAARMPRPRARRMRRPARPRAPDPEDGRWTFPKIHWPQPALAG